MRSSTEEALGYAREGLGAFARLTWPRFQLPRHIARIIEELERLERGENDRLMLFLPPRHGKSWLASWFYPAWYLGRHPDRAIIATSYGAALASDFGGRVRNTLLDPRFCRVFPNAEIRADSKAAHRFNLTAGGAYYGLGFGGPLTGRGANLILIDDPIKNSAEANSAIHRQSLHSWYESTLYTRLEPEAAIVLISTRWHEDDLAGWLLREHADEHWTVVNLPALAEPGDLLGRREGTALWPERYPVKRLARIRAQVGGPAWAAEYQQRPAAVEGAIFKRQWWNFYESLPPKFEQIVISMDTAYKAGATNDYTVALVMGVTKTGKYVLDVMRGRYEFPDLVRRTEALAERWRPVDRVLIEDKGSGTSLLQALRFNSDLPIISIKVDVDKVERANAATFDIEAGRVFLPKSARWMADFLDELSSFPNAPHDDQVDALSQTLNYLKGEGGSFDRWYRTVVERTHDTAIDYASWLHNAGGHYGVACMNLNAAMKTHMTVLEFQHHVEAQVGGPEPRMDDEDDRPGAAGMAAYMETARRLGCLQ